MFDDVLNYLEIRGLTGNHRTSEVSQGSSNACEPLTKLQVQEQTNQKSLCLSQPKLFIWSGADESGLRSLASLYAKHLSWYSTVRAPEKYLENLAYTLSKRSSLRWKSCIVASSVRELHQLLEEGLSTVTRSTISRKIGFVFTGQRAQWHAMGRELLNFPVFRDSLLDAESLLDRLGCTWRLTGMVFIFL